MSKRQCQYICKTMFAAVHMKRDGIQFNVSLFQPYSKAGVLTHVCTSIHTGSAGEFSSPESTLCADSYLVSVLPLLPQQQINDPIHSAKSAGNRLHLNMHTPLTQQSQSGLSMPLSRHSVETYPETSSHATCQGTFGHSRLSSLCHCGLILAWRVKLLCMS